MALTYLPLPSNPGLAVSFPYLYTNRFTFYLSYICVSTQSPPPPFFFLRPQLHPSPLLISSTPDPGYGPFRFFHGWTTKSASPSDCNVQDQNQTPRYKCMHAVFCLAGHPDKLRHDDLHTFSYELTIDDLFCWFLDVFPPRILEQEGSIPGT